MTDSLTFTIPNTPAALFRTGAALVGMARDMGYKPEQPAERTGPQRVPAGGEPEGGISLRPAPPPTDEQTNGHQPDSSGDGSSDTPIPSSDDTAANGGELDADGLPWDERIHSSSQKKNQDGTWRKRKGVAAETVQQVEAELRGEHQGTDPGPAPAPAPAPPAPPAPPAGGDQSEPITFAGLMQAMTSAGTSKEQLDAALERVGAANIQSVAAEPEKVQALHAELFGNEQ